MTGLIITSSLTLRVNLVNNKLNLGAMNENTKYKESDQLQWKFMELKERERYLRTH